MNIVVTGKSGQLGYELARRMRAVDRAVMLDRDALDLAEPDAIEKTLRGLRPAVVVNAAAYTAVDRAETERDAAFRVNADAPAAIARVCREIGAALIHFSTDYVFDGAKPGRYVESDEPRPLNVYGASKLAGERAVMESGAAALVLRTTWVYGDHGGNFLKTMLRLSMERERLRVVCDQRGAPTWAGRLAEAVRHIVDLADGQPDPLAWFESKGGLYHACAAGQTNWCDYARAVVETAATIPGVRERLRISADRIEPIPTAEYPTPAARPLNSLLDTSRFEREFGFRFPDWREDVEACVRRVAPTMA